MLKTITHRQFAIIIFLSMIALNFLTLPALMYSIAGHNSIITIFIGMIIDVILIMIAYKLLKDSKEKNFYEYSKKYLGTIATKGITILLLVGFLIQLFISSYELFYYISDNLYDEMRWIIFSFPLVTCIGITAYRGIRNIARSSEYLFIFIVVGVTIIMIKGVPNAQFFLVPETIIPELENIFSAYFSYSAWIGSASIIYLMFGKIDFSTPKKSYIFWAVAGSIVLTQIVVFIFYGLFQVTANQHYFALADISQISSTASSLYRLQWLIISIWIVELLIYSSILLYCCSKCLRFTLPFLSKDLSIVLLMIAILVWLYFSYTNNNIVNYLSNTTISIIILSYNFIPPIILGTARLLKGRKE